MSARHILAVLFVAALAACARTAQPDLSGAPSPPAEMAATPSINAAEPKFEIASTERAPESLKAHVLNIGAGVCSIVECPGRDAAPIIFDCGSLGGTSNDMRKDQVAAFIKAVIGRHEKAPIVVVTHPDTDHYKFIPSALDGVRPQAVWLGGKRSNYFGEMSTWIGRQEASGVPVHIGFEPGYRNDGKRVPGLQCGEADAFIRTVNVGHTDNANSLVVSLKYGEFGMTFSGDAEGETQASIIGNHAPDEVDTTVLVAPHHGAITHGSNTADWADALKAEAVVFSAGRMFRHPRCEAFRPYRAYLDAAGPHRVQCGWREDYAPYYVSRKTEYVTEINGKIIVTGRPDGSYRVSCGRSRKCDRAVLVSGL